MSGLTPNAPRTPGKPLTFSSRRVLNTLIWNGRLERRKTGRGLAWFLYPHPNMPRWNTHGSTEGEICEVKDILIRTLQAGGWLRARFCEEGEIIRDDVPGWECVADLFAGGKDDGIIDTDGRLRKPMAELPLYLQKFLSERTYTDARRIATPHDRPRPRRA